MNKALVFLVLSAALLLPVSAAGAKGPLAVTVSIPPLKYFAEKIGGEEVSVTVMAAKGQDPHSYEPTAAQMQGIAGAELYFAIGVPFETRWVPNFHSLNPSMLVVDLLGPIPRITNKPDLALRDTLPGKGRHDHEHDGHGNHHHHGLDTDDPHVWLSPSDMARTVPLITAALTDKRPAKKDAFESRAQALLESILALDAEISALFAGNENRTFLTFHQSWAHYAANYHLREASVELEGREPGPKSMAMLMDFAKANNVRVIVADSMASRTMVRAIADTIGARVVTAEPLAEDWPAALLKFSKTLADALQGTK